MRGGSFGRRWLELNGGHSGNVSYFASANALTEDGWRDFSPSRLGQFFGNVEWRDGTSSLGVSVAGGLGRLVGNGPAPVELLGIDRRAIFTHPDRTTSRAALISLRGSRTLSGARSRRLLRTPRKDGTFNGDDTTYDECENEEFEELLCEDDGEGDPVRTPDGNLIPVDDNRRSMAPTTRRKPVPPDGAEPASDPRFVAWRPREPSDPGRELRPGRLAI